MCKWLLDKICEVVEEIPLLEFHGKVKATIYRCNGRCFRVDPEVPWEDYDEEIYEVKCP